VEKCISSPEKIIANQECHIQQSCHSILMRGGDENNQEKNKQKQFMSTKPTLLKIPKVKL
jgi:hypothetical protein